MINQYEGQALEPSAMMEQYCRLEAAIRGHGRYQNRFMQVIFSALRRSGSQETQLELGAQAVKSHRPASK